MESWLDTYAPYPGNREAMASARAAGYEAGKHLPSSTSQNEVEVLSERLVREGAVEEKYEIDFFGGMCDAVMEKRPKPVRRVDPQADAWDKEKARKEGAKRKKAPGNEQSRFRNKMRGRGLRGSDLEEAVRLKFESWQDRDIREKGEKASKDDKRRAAELKVANDLGYKAWITARQKEDLDLLNEMVTEELDKSSS